MNKDLSDILVEIDQLPLNTCNVNDDVQAHAKSITCGSFLAI